MGEQTEDMNLSTNLNRKEGAFKQCYVERVDLNSIFFPSSYSRFSDLFSHLLLLQFLSIQYFDRDLLTSRLMSGNLQKKKRNERITNTRRWALEGNEEKRTGARRGVQ